MKTVKKFMNKIEGQILADFLSKNDIHCILASDDEGGFAPHLGMMTGYELRVDNSRIEEALELIASFETDNGEL